MVPFSLTTENDVHPLLVQAASKVASSLICERYRGGNPVDTVFCTTSEDWRRSIVGATADRNRRRLCASPIRTPLRSDHQTI